MVFDFPAAYDELNPDDHDHRFYAALAGELGATRVVDLGCGTGRLACLLASAGMSVLGVDPDPDMLRVARGRPGGARVRWRLGRSDRLDTASADLAVMSGHVAQVFTDDAQWSGALADLHRALVPGGTLAFESRDPAAGAWRRWTRQATLRTVGSPDGPVEFWHETTSVELPLVGYDTVVRHVRTGAVTRSRDVLAFRDRQALTASVQRAGLHVSAVFGDWDRSAPAPRSPEIIVVAHRY